MQHKKEKEEVKKHLTAEALEPLETVPPQILMALKTLVMMQLRRVDRQNVGCQSPGNKVSVPVEDKKMVGFLECNSVIGVLQGAGWMERNPQDSQIELTSPSLKRWSTTSLYAATGRSCFPS